MAERYIDDVKVVIIVLCIVTVKAACINQMAVIKGFQQQGPGESSGAVLQGS